MTCLAVTVAMHGCGFADVDTGQGTGELAPDLTGAYTGSSSKLVGCTETFTALPIDGTLGVSGEADALRFTWKAFSAVGTVDSAYTVSLAGSGDYEGRAIELLADGLATQDDGWLLDLYFELSVAPVDSGEAPCTVEGAWQATPVSDG